MKEQFLKQNQHIKREVGDVRLLRIEYYNPNDFEVLIERDERFTKYIQTNLITLGEKQYILKPNSFLILPHQYWIMWAKNGAPTFQLIENIGAMIGKGNKKASRPEVKKVF